jgi:hypothetical protein
MATIIVSVSFLLILIPLWYIISYHIISYHIISYHIITDISVIFSRNKFSQYMLQISVVINIVKLYINYIKTENNINIYIFIFSVKYQWLDTWRWLLQPKNEACVEKCSRICCEYCVLLGYDVARSRNFLPTFRDKLSVPSSGFKNQNPFGFLNPEDGTEISVRSYHYVVCLLLGCSPATGEQPKRKQTTFKTRRKFKIKTLPLLSVYWP